MTAQDAINRAIQRSAMNNPDLVPTAQMLGYLSSYERAVYAMGAKYNPEFFGAETDVTRVLSTDSWDLSAESIFALTAVKVAALTGSPDAAVGDTVNLVSFRFPELQVSPRAYVRGQQLYGYGLELGIDEVDLVTDVTIYYSDMPIPVTTTTQALTIPEEWSDLVIVPLARLLALRDNRPGDVQVLDAEYNSLVATFIDHVSVYDHGATRPLIAVGAATATRPPAGAPLQPGAPRVFG